MKLQKVLQTWRNDLANKGQPELVFKRLVDLNQPYNEGIKGNEVVLDEGWCWVFPEYQAVFWWIKLEEDMIHIFRGWKYFDLSRITHQFSLTKEEWKTQCQLMS